MAIKGPWGVGKTYFWNHYLPSSKQPGDIKKYAYVSLFGAGSPKDIYNAIISSTRMPWNVGAESPEWWENLAEKKPLEWLAKFLKMPNVPVLGNTSLLVDFIIEKSITKYLICFDDLERKDEGLKPQAFLGIVSHLKETKGCKIILIYNDEEITDQSLTKAIATARDKIVDVEIKYSPTVAANIEVLRPSCLFFRSTAKALSKRFRIEISGSCSEPVMRSISFMQNTLSAFRI